MDHGHFIMHVLLCVMQPLYSKGVLHFPLIFLLSQEGLVVYLEG